jgi:hypothetical protein
MKIGVCAGAQEFERHAVEEIVASTGIVLLNDETRADIVFLVKGGYCPHRDAPQSPPRVETACAVKLASLQPWRPLP